MNLDKDGLASERARRFHRRAQKAEGRVAAANAELDSWEAIFSNPRREGAPFVNLVIQSLRRALKEVR